MAIRRLPEELIRRIRAGEVVERPASAVKELIENALDAGASTIRISIERGGKGFISVADDGLGIERDDLLLSLERHATSKLENGDLAKIGTLGFRGEALAAIAAVAEVRIESLARGSDCAWTITSGRGEAKPCARAPGTTVVAHSLFQHHPARAAFLKSDRQEAAAVRGAVEAAALTRPDVSWHLEADGRRVLSFPAGSWEDRAKFVMGKSFAANCTSFSAEAAGISVRGLIGLPGWKGHAAAGQRFSINGRPVRDRSVGSALRAAFMDFGGEAAPSAVVELELDPVAVDVNAHPSKLEVRLLAGDEVAAFLKAAVRRALIGTSGLASEALSAAAARAAEPIAIGQEGDRRRCPLGRGMGVAHGGYACCETMDGVILVDLHAAAERMTYERLRQEAVISGVRSRALASPIVIEVGAAAAEAMDSRSGGLARLGLVVNALDDTSIVVTAIPELVRDAAARDLASAVAGELTADPHSDPLGDALDRICATLACHAAFRFGDDLSLDGLDALLRSFEEVGVGSVCMHGRPLFVFLSKPKLAGLFGRT